MPLETDKRGSEEMLVSAAHFQRFKVNSMMHYTVIAQSAGVKVNVTHIF